MSKTVKISKGFDIKLIGESEQKIQTLPHTSTYAIKPEDFKGIIPKLQVEIGSEVKAGTVLFKSKNNESINFCSPVSGEVVEIKRGEKRVIQEIKILADTSISYLNFGSETDFTTQTVKNKLLESGAWVLIKQRPFNKVANPLDTPKAIFVSCFDSSPLASDTNFIIKGNETHFQLGINALSTLANIKLGLSSKLSNSSAYTDCKNAEVNYFDGPHPAGNVGIQIHHINPINKGEAVWTLTPQDVIIIGKLFATGNFDCTKTIAIAGSEVKSPCYVTIVPGCNIENISKELLNTSNARIISGNVLTGKAIEPNGYLGFYDNQITAIEEGKHSEFLGWLIPSYPRPSMSKTFLSWLSPNKKYKVNSNMHGEERAFVMTGEYEKLLPMDIHPVYLLKAIMAQDIEAMESLGIYEVSEEDFALCEFACTSKIDVQQIIKEGLELIEKEG